MTAFYPLRITADWSTEAIRDAVATIATVIDCHATETLNDVHESDAHRTIDAFIRDHQITRPQAIERLLQQQSQLVERYERVQYRWQKNGDEIDLVLANDNLIPFPDNDIATSGELRFACGWVEFIVPDWRIEQLRLHDHARKLPLLISFDSD